jgi:hypothetical protein
VNWLQVASLFTGSANAGVVARRVGLLLAGMGLAWTLLAGGVGVAMWGLVVLLSQWMPTAVAVLATGAAAAVGASVVLFRRRAAGPPPPGPEQLVVRYPFESVMVAVATGFLVGHSDEVRTLLLREIVRMVPRKGA